MGLKLLCQAQMWLDDWDGKVPVPVILKPRPLWSGKQIINMFLPRVNLVRKASWYNDKEPVDLSPTDSQVIYLQAISPFHSAHFLSAFDVFAAA